MRKAALQQPQIQVEPLPRQYDHLQQADKDIENAASLELLLPFLGHQHQPELDQTTAFPQLRPGVGVL